MKPTVTRRALVRTSVFWIGFLGLAFADSASALTTYNSNLTDWQGQARTSPPPVVINRDQNQRFNPHSIALGGFGRVDIDGNIQANGGTRVYGDMGLADDKDGSFFANATYDFTLQDIGGTSVTLLDVGLSGEGFLEGSNVFAGATVVLRGGSCGNTTGCSLLNVMLPNTPGFDFNMFDFNQVLNLEVGTVYNITVEIFLATAAQTFGSGRVLVDPFVDPMVEGIGVSFDAASTVSNPSFPANIPPPVPVPAAAWLFGSGLGFLGWIRRRNMH